MAPDRIIADAADRLERQGVTRTANLWAGVDLTRDDRTVRLTVEDDNRHVHYLIGQACAWSTTFSPGTPTGVIAATAAAALDAHRRTRRDEVDAWVAGVIDTPDHALEALRDEVIKCTRADRIARLSRVIADALGCTVVEARARAVAQ